MVVKFTKPAGAGLRGCGFSARIAMGAPFSYLFLGKPRPVGSGSAFRDLCLAVLSGDGLGDPSEKELASSSAFVGVHRVLFHLAVVFLGAFNALPDVDLSCPGAFRRVGPGQAYDSPA